MDYINVLRWFENVVETGSFSATAENFNVTTGAISQGISRLERKLGTRLLNRTTRQLNLTMAGQIYCEKTRDILSKLDEAAALVREMTDEPSGRVAIAMDTYFDRTYFMRMLSDFMERYPKIELDVVFSNTTNELITEKLDLAIVSGMVKDPKYVTRLLCRMPLVIVASPAYLEVAGRPNSPADLVRHQWVGVMLPRGSAREHLIAPTKGRRQPEGKRTIRANQKHYLFKLAPPADSDRTHSKMVGDDFGIQERPRLRFDGHYDMCIEAALAGLGLTTITLSQAWPYFQSGQLQQVLPDHEVHGFDDLYIKYPSREYLPQKVRVLIDFLIERCNADPCQVDDQ